MTRKTIFQFLRWTLAGALLYLVFSSLKGESFLPALRTALENPTFLIAGLFMTFLGLCIGTLRWHFILNFSGIHISRFRCFQIQFMGQFLNNFFPGACGGDAARAYYICKERSRGERAEAATTVIADRAIGLFVMLLFGATCSIIFYNNLFSQHKALQAAAYVLWAALAAGLLGILILFSSKVEQYIPRVTAKIGKAQWEERLQRIYTTLSQFRKKPQLLLPSLLYSLLMMSCLTLAVACFGMSLEAQLSIVDYFILFPIISVLAAIPITPGALGLRETLFITLFGTIGMAASTALSLSLINYFSGLIWGLPGWLFLFQNASNSGQSIKDSIHDIGPLPDDPK